MSAPDQPLVPWSEAVARVTVIGPSGTVYTHLVGWRSQPGQTPEQRDAAKARAEAKRARRRARNRGAA